MIPTFHIAQFGRRIKLPAGGGGPATTWNPADKGADITLSNGNLTATKTTGTGWQSVRATTSKASGKWYWEVKVDTGTSVDTMLFVGVGKATASLTNFCGSDADGWGYLNVPARSYNNNSFSAYGATWATNGDVMGIKWDADLGILEFLKNNTSQGVAFASGVTGTIFPMASLNADSGTNPVITGQFSAASLTYSVPALYSAIGG